MSEKVKSPVTALRDELLKIMPGYNWTVHKPSNPRRIEATGTMSSGSNRLSTLHVLRTDRDGDIWYEAKSAGYGTRARWLRTGCGLTLARALRDLQQQYERAAAEFRGHAAHLETGRKAKEVRDA